MANNRINTCERNLLYNLVNNFPRKIDLDYFELCNISPAQTLWAESEVATAEHLISMIDLMRSQNLLDADFFLDGERRYFWNVCLQVEGYETFKKRLEVFMADSSIEFRDLLGSVLRDKKGGEQQR
ncbi:hypothetical protein [Labrys sp. 22185]|uniref:hypothetical protein n=1 Tax=Labrys sp. 22185 TaxID=3453888 RepID=UPI003F82ABE1